MTKKEQTDLLYKGTIQSGGIPFHPILMHFAARFNGNTYGQFASDHRVLVDCNLKALEQFGMDMVGLISDPYRETSAFGAPIEFIAEGVPKCLDTIVRNLDDVKQLQNPDVYKAARTLDRIRAVELYQKLLRGSVPVIGWIEGPLAEACDLAGVGEMLVYLMTDADLCHFLMDKCLVTAKDFARAQVLAGCDIIGIGDAICSQIDLETYDQFVKQRHKDLVDFIHSLHAQVKLHICGDITHLLPSLKDLQADILDLDYKVDMDLAHHILGSQVVRCGNINPLFIQDSTDEELSAACKDIIAKEKGRKFILSGGCEITVNTSPRKLGIMKKAAHGS